MFGDKPSDVKAVASGGVIVAMGVRSFVKDELVACSSV